MKIRTVYQKVPDLGSAKNFWTAFLGISPSKDSPKWCEFQLENIRFALLLNDYGDKFQGSNSVPVFELSEAEMGAKVEKAKALGATVVLDGLADPKVQSIVLKDRQGNEFELSKVHS